MTKLIKRIFLGAVIVVLGGAVIFSAVQSSSNPNKSSSPKGLAINETGDEGVWQYNRMIRIDNAADSALTDHQIKIELNSLNFDFEKADSDGDDIRFTEENKKTEIPNYWIESWNAGEAAIIWVKVPYVPASSTKKIYIHYGNLFANSTSNFNNTFTKDYGESGLVGLWHMDTGSGTIAVDSSGQGNNGIFKAAGEPAWVGSDGGQWNNRNDVNFLTGDSLSFDGNDYIDCGSNPSLDIINAITVETWVKNFFGTPITNCAELQNIKNDLTEDYYLANNIDCLDTKNWNGGAGFQPIGNYPKFTGTFNGRGYKIINLYINRRYNYVGLFGCADTGSEIKNVVLENINMKCAHNCLSGGLVGKNSGTISNSYSTGSVSGGLYDTGGLVGKNFGTISNSYSTSSVSGSYNVGGLVGNNWATISNSYSTGSVSAPYTRGGLVGWHGGTISNSYSTGSVSGAWGPHGGLVGDRTSGTIINSYWNTETSGESSSAGGTGKTTAQMKQQTTFVGWNFDNIWGIKENVTYPFLWLREILVSKGKDAYSLQMNWNDSTLYGYINNNQIIASVSESAKWHHCVLTFDGADQKLFIDGVLENTTSPGGTIGANGNSVKIGDKFSGAVDEVRIYNRVLSAEEITSHFERRKYIAPEPSVTVGKEKTVQGGSY